MNLELKDQHKKKKKRKMLKNKNIVQKEKRKLKVKWTKLMKKLKMTTLSHKPIRTSMNLFLN